MSAHSALPDRCSFSGARPRRSQIAEYGFVLNESVEYIDAGVERKLNLIRRLLAMNERSAADDAALADAARRLSLIQRNEPQRTVPVLSAGESALLNSFR